MERATLSSSYEALKSFDTSKVFYAFLVIFAIERLVAFQRNRRTFNYLPGPRYPFSPMGVVGALLHNTTWWQAGLDVNWAERERLYRSHETVVSIPWLVGAPMVYTSSLEVMKQVVSSSQAARFIKTPEVAAGMRIFGDSVFSAEGEGWRRHRRIVGPAFGSALYRLVWEQSLKTYREMISEEGWTDKKSVDIPVLQAATFKFALVVLGLCAFGFDFNWSAPPATAQGEMTVQQVMRIVLDNHVFLVFAPEWLKRLPFPSIRHTVGAYTKLEQFMKDQVQIRREEIRGHTTGEYTRRDAFSMLVQANESEGEKHKLDDMELIGNIYVMLVAGHETTAHTLAATLGFLAIHQDAQDEVVQQIVDVVGYERDPAFEDYHSLNKVLAAFYEALRFFPAGHIVLRVLSDDTIIQIPNPRGEEGTQPLPVPKETWFIADMIGIHRNPRHFEEPDKYKPSRWHDMNNDSEQFTAFSFGPRACIGRKFATTEALCFLTMFLRDWEVQPILRPGESTEQWQSRVLDGKISFTLGAKDVPIRLTRRERK